MSDWDPECESLFEAGRSIRVDPDPDARGRNASAVARRLAVGVGVVTATTPAAAAGLGTQTASFATVKAVVAMTLVVGGVATAVVATSPLRASFGGLSRGAPASPLANAARPATLAEASASISDTAATPSTALAAAPAPSSAPAEASTTRACCRVRRPDRDDGAPAPESSPATLVSPTGLPGVTSAPAASVAVAPADPTEEGPPAYDAFAEIGALRRIDEALRGGDFARATRLLDEHDATFGAGHLVQECEGARILALCGSGQKRAATRKACSFFATYPRSPMRARIEQLCPARCDGEEP